MPKQSNNDFEHFKKQFSAEYTSGLRTYLAEGGEDLLRQAYELGRVALSSGLGILDLVEIHHQALKTILPRSSRSEIYPRVNFATVFLEECLSSFEITHRGYRDAVEAMRRVTSFASLASHEVKAPLTSIISSASMLQELLKPDRQSPQDKLLANILKGAAILKSHTDDLLDIAGFYSGKLTVRMRSVDLVDFLRQSYEHLKPEVYCRGMQFNLDIPPTLPVVEVDPDRLGQVITNLVQNAVKYAADGGCIDLGASATGSVLIIGVRDYGKGIGPGQPMPMLTPGRLSGSVGEAAGGRGLGLILCKQIVEAHHGQIILESKPGRGSLIQVLLPLAKQSQEMRDKIESIDR